MINDQLLNEFQNTSQMTNDQLLDQLQNILQRQVDFQPRIYENDPALSAEQNEYARAEFLATQTALMVATLFSNEQSSSAPQNVLRFNAESESENTATTERTDQNNMNFR